MITSVIVATSSNMVIGKDNQLPWHLPADLKFFKNVTMGHHILMGRKTYESIGKALPGRTTVIITRNKDYKADGCTIVHSIEEAIAIAKGNNETEAFIIGGADIINASINTLVDKVYLTEIKQEFEGDAFLETLNTVQWKEIKRTTNSPDEKNIYAYDFVELIKTT